MSEIAILQQLAYRVEFHTMKNAHLLVFAAMGMSALLCGVSQTFAQGTPSQQAQVVLSKLSPPIYPPLARVARVLGDVEIAIQIRPDGSVASAEVVEWPPIIESGSVGKCSTIELRVSRVHSISYKILSRLYVRVHDD